MRSTLLFVTSAFAAATSFAAAPQATVTDLAFDEDNGFVSVCYTLTDTAVVTADFLVKDSDGGWTSLGAENFTALSGDVNRRVTVAPGKAFRLSWNAFSDGCGRRLSAGSFKAVVTAWPVSAPPTYMAIDLTAPNTVRYYASSNAVPGGVMDPKYRTTVLLLRKIPSANREWRMGLGAGEWEFDYGGLRESAHLVKLTSDFYMTVFPVTQAQTHAIVQNVSAASNDADWQMRPVENTAYNTWRAADWPTDGNSITNWCYLKKFRDHSGVMLDLPLDAQYEFACRAGSAAQLYAGAYSAQFHTNELCGIAWTSDNAGGRTHEVGLLQPNGYGLYDMLGNVRSICRDWYVEDLRTLGDAAYLDPKGPASGSSRVARGSPYSGGAITARNSYRTPEDPSEATGRRSVAGVRFVCPAIAEL